MDPISIAPDVQEFQGVRYRFDGYYFRTHGVLHRAVWEAAHGPVPDGWHVHHKNHRKDDNRLENLIAIAPKPHADETWASRTPETRVCARCGHDFECITLRRRDRFCSPRCRMAARRAAGIDSVEKPCVICGTVYWADRYNHSQTCSRSCRARLREQRKRST